MVILHRLSKGAAGIIGLGQEAYANQQQKKQLSRAEDGQEAAVVGDTDEKALEDDRLTNAKGHVERHLPAPVVIPQRRPNARDRGFLCAYAPALAACDISQEVFVDFLDGFRNQAKKGGAFVVLNIAVSQFGSQLDEDNH